MWQLLIKELTWEQPLKVLIFLQFILELIWQQFNCLQKVVDCGFSQKYRRIHQRPRCLKLTTYPWKAQKKLLIFFHTTTSELWRFALHVNLAPLVLAERGGIKHWHKHCLKIEHYRKHLLKEKKHFSRTCFCKAVSTLKQYGNSQWIANCEFNWKMRSI